MPHPGWQSISIRDELREAIREHLKESWRGKYGYPVTVSDFVGEAIVEKLQREKK